MTVEDAEHRLEHGDFIHIPRGLVRSFTNVGSSNGRVLILHCPGSAADFYIGMGKLLFPPKDRRHHRSWRSLRHRRCNAEELQHAHALRAVLLVGDGMGTATASAGCSADRPMNPEFPVTVAQARDALRAMEREPKPLKRPLVIATGLYDPGFVCAHIRSVMRRACGGDERIIAVSFFWCFNFDSCRARLIKHVEAAFPSDDPRETVEVDVIGYSMGGLIARAAAIEGNGKRLRVNRLFTIATPHRGARMAPVAFCDRRAIDMRAGSRFLAGLDEEFERAEYELHCYVRLRDWIIGEENAAPEGREALWVSKRPIAPSHMLAGHDSRILADIARHLRGEEPPTT